MRKVQGRAYSRNGARFGTCVQWLLVRQFDQSLNKCRHAISLTNAQDEWPANTKRKINRAIGEKNYISTHLLLVSFLLCPFVGVCIFFSPLFFTACTRHVTSEILDHLADNKKKPIVGKFIPFRNGISAWAARFTRDISIIRPDATSVHSQWAYW